LGSILETLKREAITIIIDVIISKIATPQMILIHHTKIDAPNDGIITYAPFVGIT